MGASKPAKRNHLLQLHPLLRVSLTLLVFSLGEPVYPQTADSFNPNVNELALLDVFTVRAPGPVLAWVSRVSSDSPAGVFLLGATSGLVAAPCGAPAFAAVLTFVGATWSAVLGFLYLFVFALGMTALLVAIGLFAGLAGALPRSGAWTVWVKRAGGVLLLAMAEYYFIQMGKVS